MGKPDPKKRKSLHDEAYLDEIRDNVKNNAVLSQARSRRVYSNQANDDDDLRAISSDDEEEEEVFYSHSERNLNETYEVINPLIKSRINISLDSNNRLLKKELSKRSYQNKENIQSKLSSSNKSQQRGKNENVSETRAKTSSKSSNSTFLCGLVSLFLVIIFIFVNRNNGMFSTEEEIKNDFKTDPRLQDLKLIIRNNRIPYKNQENDTWLYAYASLANIILDKEKPSIILLLGKETATIECLAQLFGTIGSDVLECDKLILKPENLEPDMGSVINMLRSNSIDKKAVIVSDLLNVNAEALKAFHNLCDRINPLVKEVIYIFTIIAENFQEAKNYNVYKFVEEELFKKLSGKIKEDSIQPLITRITDGPILRIISESHIKTINDCPTIWKKDS